MTNERFLKWAAKRYYKRLGCKVSIRRIRTLNTEIDGEAFAPNGYRIAIELKTPQDDLARGIGQLTEALAHGYDKAALVTTFRNAKKINDRVFHHFGIALLGVDCHGQIHVLADRAC
jgi:hypothetical protein